MKNILFLLALLLTTTVCKAQVLYTNTIETGNRYNPGLNQNNTVKIAFDDVLIPAAEVIGSDSVCITKIKLGIRRITGAEATDVKIYCTVLEDTSTQLASRIKIPPVLLGTVSLPANTAGSFTQVVSVGDSINTLFKIKTNIGAAYPGYQAVFIGVAFTNSDANNGIRLSNTFGVNNEDAIWVYNADSSVPRYVTNFGANPTATFHIQLFGRKQNAVLPVAIKNIRAEQVANGNLISWTTSSELNNAGFHVQRSNDGSSSSFQSIYFMQAAASGSSTMPKDYAYIDMHPLKGNNYYRLVQVDKDGHSSYSTMVMVSSSKATMAMPLKVYPVPVIDNATIELQTRENNYTCTMVVYDMLGATLYKKEYVLQFAGLNTINLKLDGRYKKGTYHVHIIGSNNEDVGTTSFIKL